MLPHDQEGSLLQGISGSKIILPSPRYNFLVDWNIEVFSILREKSKTFFFFFFQMKSQQILGGQVELFKEQLCQEKRINVTVLKETYGQELSTVLIQNLEALMVPL